MTIARVKKGDPRRCEGRHAQHTGRLVHWQPKSFAFATHHFPQHLSDTLWSDCVETDLKQVPTSVSQTLLPKPLIFFSFHHFLFFEFTLPLLYFRTQVQTCLTLLMGLSIPVCQLAMLWKGDLSSEGTRTLIMLAVPPPIPLLGCPNEWIWKLFI